MRGNQAALATWRTRIGRLRPVHIAELLGRGRPTVSFEFMAPRDESEVDVLEKTVAALAGHAPDWVSVTYRLRTGEKTLELVTRIKRQYHIEAMAHLTCANSRDETRRILNWMEREGIANVLALRGDPPGPGEPFQAGDRRRLQRGEAPREPRPRARVPLPATEGRGRRGFPHHPAVLRQPLLLRPCSASSRGRYRGSHRSRSDARPEPPIAVIRDPDVGRHSAREAAEGDR